MHVPRPENGRIVGGFTPQAYVWGYDAVRFVAIACVALRHLLSIYDLDPTIVPVLIGLPAFSALSGYLALRSRGEAGAWLGRRLLRIYSAYLPFVACILLASYVTAYKPVTLPLVASQLLGIAALTHPDQLVGVHTWFISFIVVCYVSAALVRWKGSLLWLLAASAVVASVYEIRLASLFLTFIAGGIVTTMRSVRVGAAALAAGFLAAYAATNDFAWAAGASGMLSLLVGSFLTGPRPALIGFTSRITYEFYLWHGPVYLALARFAEAPFAVTLTAGSVLAVACAFVLHLTARQLRLVVVGRTARTKEASPERAPLVG